MFVVWVLRCFFFVFTVALYPNNRDGWYISEWWACIVLFFRLLRWINNVHYKYPLSVTQNNMHTRAPTHLRYLPTIDSCILMISFLCVFILMFAVCCVVPFGQRILVWFESMRFVGDWTLVSLNNLMTLLGFHDALQWLFCVCAMHLRLMFAHIFFALDKFSFIRLVNISMECRHLKYQMVTDMQRSWKGNFKDRENTVHSFEFKFEKQKQI